MRPAAALAVLVLLALAAAGARAESGSILLTPGEEGEVPIAVPFTGARVVYTFNTTPVRPVEFNVHYLKDGGVVYDKPPVNKTGETSTFFPLRSAPFFLAFENWGEDTVRVAYEWHFARPVPTTRDTPSAPALAVGALAAAALAAGSKRLL